jgi:hypothetical protein
MKALYRVVDSLQADNPAGAKAHVPYRDSKITRLLRPALGAHGPGVPFRCGQIFFAFLSAGADAYEQSHAVLAFAAKVGTIAAGPSGGKQRKAGAGPPAVVSFNFEAETAALSSAIMQRCGELGVEYEGLKSHGIQLDMESPDELVELQKWCAEREALEKENCVWADVLERSAGWSSS